MPEHLVIAGAVSYVDSDGMERWAYSGQTVDFTREEADRLMGVGALHDEKAAQAAEKAEQDLLDSQRELEDRRRQDEAERVAGERAAAAKAAQAGQKAAPKSS